MKSVLIRLSLACLFAATSLFGAAQKFSSAIELNEYFVTITDTLYMGGQEWGKKLNEAVKTKDFTTLAPARKKMEKFIDSKQQELKKMKDYWGSEKLRLAFLDFLAYEKTLIEQAFAPLEKLNKSSTAEEINAGLTKVTQLAEKENIENRKIGTAQEEFATKNGFTIEEN